MNSKLPAGFTPARLQSEIPAIGVGMLGFTFMGKAHSNAFQSLRYMMYPPPAMPRLIAMCGLPEEKAALAEAAARYGYEGYYTDWRQLVEDERIELVDIGAPNDVHAAPSIEAAQAGKNVLCEKPLARSAEEAWEMLYAVRKAGIKHMTGFSYRFAPAVRYIRQVLESGTLGRLLHFRAIYLQEWLLPHFNTPKTWRLDRVKAGNGASGELASHIIDLAHYLVGDIRSVCALARTFYNERPLPGSSDLGTVDVDDAFVAAIEFENGAIGTLEGSRIAAGRPNHEVIEINGEKGSIRWNLERLNEVELYLVDEDPVTNRGFRTILVTDPAHPWIRNWWPPGHIIGWEHLFIHEITHFLDCIVNVKEVAPYGATFEDGYKACVVSDAILKSSETKYTTDCSYNL